MWLLCDIACGCFVTSCVVAWHCVWLLHDIAYDCYMTLYVVTWHCVVKGFFKWDKQIHIRSLDTLLASSHYTDSPCTTISLTNPACM